MRKYKKISLLAELQEKLDKKFGKGLCHAGFIFLLFTCLAVTSCKPEGGKIPENTVEVPSPQAEREAPRTPAPKIIIEKTGQTGTLNNKPSNSDYPEGPCVVDAYFAKKDEGSGEYEKIKSSALGETVYVVVDTIGLIGKEISLNILDKNKILTEKTYDKISFLKNDKISDGTYREKVRDDGYAIYNNT